MTPSDFSYLKIGSSVYKKATLIIYYKQNKIQRTRIGISASRKVGKSYIRNRVKRVIREYFRLSEFRNLSHDILFVISWSKGLKEDPFAQREIVLKKNLKEFFHFLEDETLRAKV